jgi:WD40 repeat protein
VRHVSLLDGKALGVFDCYPSDSEIVSLAVSPDGKHLAVGGSPEEVKVLEIETGKEMDQLKNKYDRVPLPSLQRIADSTNSGLSSMANVKFSLIWVSLNCVSNSVISLPFVISCCFVFFIA